MKLLIAALALLMPAGVLSAKPVQVNSVDEMRELPLETTEVVVTRVYDKGLAALQALPNLESLTLRTWLNYDD